MITPLNPGQGFTANLVTSWLLTLPIAAILSAAIYAVIS